MASRSTFRDAVSDVAWQRQLRDRYAAEGAPPVPHLDLKRAVVRPVSRRLAEQIILKYEWLGTMVTTSYHYGLFYGPFCAGVSCVGTSSTGNVTGAAGFGIEPSQLLTFARGACVHWAPPGSNSKLIAWTCRLAARETGAKLMMAFADTDAGEIGTVYQAANWVYLGTGETGRQWLAPNGRIYDWKLPYDVRRRRGHIASVPWRAQVDALLSGGWVLQHTARKHRYTYVLDRSDTALVERVERMRHPYPKRAKHPSDAPAVQAGEGGAAPTRTLQEATV